MRVLKNLMGDGSKIHIDEIALKLGLNPTLLSEAVIVESGSNENGEYIRFGNGFQICVLDKYLGIAVNVNKSGYKVSADQTWTYPAEFGVNPVVIPKTLASGDIPFWEHLMTRNRSTAQYRIVTYNSTGFTNFNNSMLLIAAGTWK